MKAKEILGIAFGVFILILYIMFMGSWNNEVWRECKSSGHSDMYCWKMMK